jgi:hypothetical protein
MEGNEKVYLKKSDFDVAMGYRGVAYYLLNQLITLTPAKTTD